MAAGVFTPYSGVSGWVATLPSWVPTLDQERIASYQIYEEIYWSHPETFKLTLRGDESKPIYIPSGRTIVEAANRYACKGFSVGVDPALGTPADRANLLLALTNWIDRENFYATFNSNKRYGIMRGDWVFHLMADPMKEPEKRISCVAVDPASYFTVPMPDNPDRIWKIHLAETTKNDKNEDVVRRQTYTRLDDGRIQSELSLFKIDEWSKGDAKAQQVITAPYILPDQIRAFPVYHIRNSDEPGNPYGSSEMRGIESLITGINQSATDEDISLALEGLGVYASDGGGPVDEEGEDSDWIIGPGRVVENAINFRRVNGVNSVGPYQDHIKMLKQNAFEATGTSEVAVGSVDVTVAESGVALALRMSPTIAKSEEKDTLILGKMKQMFYDLVTMWFPAYESMSFGEAQALCTVGDKLPKNRDAEVKLVLELMSSPVPVLSAATARKHLANYGFEFDPGEEALILKEMAATSEAQSPSGAPAGESGFEERAAAELGTG
jgi:hypothetical protein